MGVKKKLIGNELIAKFMEIDFSIPYMWKPGSYTELKLEHLNYDKSWDWLMTCVEKIEEIDVVASFQIEQPTIYIWASSESSTFEDIEVDIFTKSKIKAVYEACIKFIKWYNNENK